MATIVPSLVGIPNSAANLLRDVIPTTLNGTADTFVYEPTVPGSILVLENPTGSPINANITGSLATSTYQVPGYARVSLAGGINTGTIASGGVKAIALGSIAPWLDGTITITNGTGLRCFILTLT